MYRVSVVVPNYNHRVYLEERLRSIARQTLPPYEVVVLDDASSDGSREWLSEHLNTILPKATLVVNAKNSGSVLKQWRKGVEIVKGDFIWIAESDDFSEPSFLAEVVGAFENSEVVLSYCQTRLVDEKRTPLRYNYVDLMKDVSPTKWTKPYLMEGEEEISTALAVKNTIPNVSAVVFRRDALVQAFNTASLDLFTWRIAGDWLLYVTLLLTGKIAFTPQSLNVHRIRADGVSHSVDAETHVEEILRVQRHIRKLLSLSAETIQKQDAYAQAVYGYYGLTASGYPRVDLHPRFRKFFSSR